MTEVATFQWPQGKRTAVSLTFDDARPTQVDAGLPILDRHGVRATFYLSPQNIEQRQDAWRSAAAHGHEMGNHTLTHPCSGNFLWSRTHALEEMTLAEMEAQIVEASGLIRDLVGVQPHSFAYPCGQKFVGRGETLQSYVPVIARHFIAGRGFRDETENDPAYVDLAQTMGVDSDDQTFEELKTWIDDAVRGGGWLVFASHDVGDFPRQAMRAEVLDAVCQYCADPDNGIWIDTVATIGAYIQQQRQQNH
jgi:peptidoglycan/xylan/chitin deacetylase (PgdA/CDA1 family)